MVRETFPEKQDTDDICIQEALEVFTPCVNPGTMFLPTLPTIAHNPNLFFKHLKATKIFYNSSLDYESVEIRYLSLEKIPCKNQNPPGREFDPERRRRLVRNLNRPGK